MTMENFPVNADDITHLQILSKGSVLQLQRNASLHVYCAIHHRVKGMYDLSEYVLIFLLKWGVQFLVMVLCPSCTLNARKGFPD
jgi:hypothetical protein